MKAQLRRELRALRDLIPPTQRRRAAVSAAHRLARIPAFRAARRIALYLDHDAELPTGPLCELCWRLGMQVFVPRVVDDRGMHFVQLRPGARLRRDRHGIRHPAGGARRIALAQLDLVIVPLLGFDARGHRIGSGGGYYDRALARIRAWPRPLRVGYAYASQCVPHIDAESWDVPLHCVVTERAVIDCTR